MACRELLSLFPILRILSDPASGPLLNGMDLPPIALACTNAEVEGLAEDFDLRNFSWATDGTEMVSVGFAFEFARLHLFEKMGWRTDRHLDALKVCECLRTDKTSCLQLFVFQMLADLVERRIIAFGHDPSHETEEREFFSTQADFWSLVGFLANGLHSSAAARKQRPYSGIFKCDKKLATFARSFFFETEEKDHARLRIPFMDGLLQENWQDSCPEFASAWRSVYDFMEHWETKCGGLSSLVGSLCWDSQVVLPGGSVLGLMSDVARNQVKLAAQAERKVRDDEDDDDDDDDATQSDEESTEETSDTGWLGELCLSPAAGIASFLSNDAKIEAALQAVKAAEKELQSVLDQLPLAPEKSAKRAELKKDMARLRRQVESKKKNYNKLHFQPAVDYLGPVPTDTNFTLYNRSDTKNFSSGALSFGSNRAMASFLVPACFMFFFGVFDRFADPECSGGGTRVFVSFSVTTVGHGLCLCILRHHARFESCSLVIQTSRCLRSLSFSTWTMRVMFSCRQSKPIMNRMSLMNRTWRCSHHPRLRVFMVFSSRSTRTGV